MGDAKAALILAALEFARRRIKPEGAKIETPADLLPHVRHYARGNGNGDKPRFYAAAQPERWSST